MRPSILVPLACGVVLAVTPASSGRASGHDRGNGDGDLGRLTIIVPREGSAVDFEEGYKRHLEWHRRNRDPWAWLGWTIVMGERPGTFVDASFGHTAADLDTPIEPAEDMEDNRRNTLPYAARIETYVVRLRDDLSTDLDDPAGHAMLQVFDYRVLADRYSDFVAGLRNVRARRDDIPYAWLEFVNGGEHARFWLLLPAGVASELNLSGLDLLPSALDVEIDEHTRELLGPSIRQVRSEVLRYRPDLSYSPPEPRG